MSDVEIDVEIRAKTPDAILVYDGKRECWIPKSQVNDYVGDDIDHAESIFISEWLAGEKGLI